MTKKFQCYQLAREILVFPMCVSLLHIISYPILEAHTVDLKKGEGAE